MEDRVLLRGESVVRIRLAFSGRNYEVARSLPQQLELPEGSAVDDALSEVERSLPAGEHLPPSCLVCVSGVHLGSVGNHRPRPLLDGDELLLIAPVAGG
jgi:molybdopterin converting factor small subunit